MLALSDLNALSVSFWAESAIHESLLALMAADLPRLPGVNTRLAGAALLLTRILNALSLAVLGIDRLDPGSASGQFNSSF